MIRENIKKIKRSIKEEGVLETSLLISTALKRRLGGPVVDRWMFLQNVDYHHWFIKNERVVTTPYGMQIMFSDPTPIEKSILRGEYKNHLVKHLISNVKNRRAKFADVGANIGFYSILFSCLSDPNNQIDSFEPVPNNLSKLMRNKEINFCDNITVHAAAVGDKYSQVVIHVPDGKEAESTMASESWSDISISRSFNISQYDLDSFYSDKTPPDLYHIDAEGAEVRIIKGMRDIIQKQPEIYLVLHPKLVFEMGNSPSELVDIFTCAGYDSIFDLETKEALPISHLETMNSETPARYYYLE